jgi:hypothetical protein
VQKLNQIKVKEKIIVKFKFSKYYVISNFILNNY